MVRKKKRGYMTAHTTFRGQFNLSPVSEIFLVSERARTYAVRFCFNVCSLMCCAADISLTGDLPVLKLLRSTSGFLYAGDWRNTRVQGRQSCTFGESGRS